MTTVPNLRCPLLSLPLELRHQIYLNVLFSSSPRPPDPDACRRDHYGIANPPNGNLGYKAVCCTPVNSNSRGLLAVNRKVRFEVSTLIAARRSQDRLDYHLDLMVENVGRLIVTPRCFPATAGHISTLRADIRFFGKYDLRRGCVALWGFSLGSFLNVFFEQGPDFIRLRNHQKPREEVTIGTLAINILSVPITPEWLKSVRTLLRPGEQHSDVEDSELALRAVEREIGNMLDCRPGLYRENHSLYERIEAVETWAGGQLRRTWDLKATAATE
ncbi:hypothetical protein ACJ41O_010377 [Fusarium nematophilum]